VKDIAVQKRENDLIIATFGRGFYILDNYSPLRDLNVELQKKDFHLFPVKDALMFMKTPARYGQGSTYYKADNPDFGAVFTYFIKEVPKTLNEKRKEKEKELFKEGKPIYQPTDEELRLEKEERGPYLVFTIVDESGNVIRKITKSAAKGINRVVWDLRYYSTSPVSIKDKFNPVEEQKSSNLVLLENIKSLFLWQPKMELKKIAGSFRFNVNLLKNTTLPAET
jgi:hypothetical protein